MGFLSKFFGKKNAKDQVLTVASSSSRPRKPKSNSSELIYKDESVGIRCNNSGETYWLPWCLFQNVEVQMREPFAEGHYSYDIMAEFHSADIEWDVIGFPGFLEAMNASLDGFNLEKAVHAISGLGRENPRATIYISPNYDEDIATRAG